MKITALLLTLTCLSTSVFAHENGTIKIFNAQFISQFKVMDKPGKLILEDGKKKSRKISQKAITLNNNLEKVRDYYATNFGRKSWDNLGSDIVASINVNRFTILDIFHYRQNAMWTTDHFTFGVGSKKGLDNFEGALDVVAHEYTHAVIQTSSGLDINGQSGALNEHLADVFGSIINQVSYPQLVNPYLIGTTVLTDELKLKTKAEALRNMLHPSKGLENQPSHMSQLEEPTIKKLLEDCKPTKKNDRCYVHSLSGIPNRMAALLIKKIGPHESAKLFYGVMTNRLKTKSQFADYRIALMEECRTLSAETCSLVDRALKMVGL